MAYELVKSSTPSKDNIQFSVTTNDIDGSSFAMIALEATYVKWCVGGHVT